MSTELKIPDTSRLSFDNKKHAYTLDGTKLLTGVTTVLDGTSSKANLINWSANMAVDHVKNVSSSEIPVEVDDKLVELFGTKVYLVSEKTLEDARTAHTRRKEAAGSKGTDVHALVEEYILSCINESGTVSFHPDILPFVTWANSEVKCFLAAEQRLYDEENAIAGTADFFYVSKNDELTTGDLKTFPKMWSADPFVQTGVYGRMWRLLTGDQPTKSVIVKLCDPEDERIKKYGNKPFAVYERYAVREDEEMFLKRLDIYRYNQNFVSPKD